MKKFLTIAVSILLLLSLAGLANAEDDREPVFSEYSDKFGLRNDDITLWLEEKKPVLRSFQTGRGVESGFKTVINNVFEIEDKNADGNYTWDEFVAYADIESVDWVVTHERVMTGMSITMNTTVDVIDPETENKLGTATVTIIFYIYSADVTIEFDNKTFNVTPAEVKFDIIIEHWPWRSSDNVLALELSIKGDGGSRTVKTPVGEIHAGPPVNIPAGQADNEADENGNGGGPPENIHAGPPEGVPAGPPDWVEDILDNDFKGVCVATNQTDIGYIKWLESATVYYENNSNSTAYVNAWLKAEDENVSLLLVYHVAGNYTRIVHDPSVGVIKISLKEVIDIMSHVISYLIATVTILLLISTRFYLVKRKTSKKSPVNLENYKFYKK